MGKATHPLRAYRKHAEPKVSLDALAKRVGRSKATLSRIENWKQAIPEELLGKLSEVTGIPARDLRPDLARLMSEASE